MPKPIYIHYGSTEYDPSRFHPIKNQFLFFKPHGGLWASRVGDPYGWDTWCKNSGYADCNEDNSFKFILRKNSKICNVASPKDLKTLPHLNPDRDLLLDLENSNMQFLDFEACLAMGYVAIELRWYGKRLANEDMHEWSTEMFGWDCNCLLVLDPDAVVPLKAGITRVRAKSRKYDVPKDVELSE